MASCGELPWVTVVVSCYLFHNQRKKPLWLRGGELSEQNKTMTVEELVNKDGQLQPDVLAAVVDDCVLATAGVVLVADGGRTCVRHSVEGCELNTQGSVLWPMLSGALGTLVCRAKRNDAEAWAVVARWFALGQEEQQVEEKLNGVRKVLMEALGGKEAENDEQ